MRRTRVVRLAQFAYVCVAALVAIGLRFAVSAIAMWAWLVATALLAFALSAALSSSRAREAEHSKRRHRG